MSGILNWCFWENCKQFPACLSPLLCCCLVSVRYLTACFDLLMSQWNTCHTVSNTKCLHLLTLSPGNDLSVQYLRLLAPPLQLLSAAVWQVVQQGLVDHYGILEEYVTMVTELVPELMSYSQKAQLIMGLRARVSNNCGFILRYLYLFNKKLSAHFNLWIMCMCIQLVLEMCRGEHPVDMQTIQPHLDRIKAPISTAKDHHVSKSSPVPHSDVKQKRCSCTLSQQPCRRQRTVVHADVAAGTSRLFELLSLLLKF